MSKSRKLIVFFLVFAIIAAGMTLMFSKRMTTSVAISAGPREPGVVTSGGIAAHPGAGSYAWVIFILGLVITGAIAFLVLRSGWRPEKLFLVTAIPLGLIYLFMMVPLAIPDEQVHYQTAYEISSVFLFKPGIGNPVHFDYTGLGGHYNLTSGYERVAQDLLAPLSSSTETQLPFYYGSSYPVMYIPQALGLAIGRLLGGNFVRIFLTGRLFNLLFYVLCVYWAIRLTPKYKTLFVMVGAMPMAIHQAASFSYDVFNIGGALLLMAAVFRARDAKGKITIREFGLMALIGLLLIPAKPTNAPLLLLYLLIPAERFENRKQRWLWIGGAWAVTLAAVLLIQMNGIFSLGVSGDTAATNWEGKQNYTIAYALAHPAEAVKVYWNTIRLNGKDLLIYQPIGSVMAGYSMIIPGRYIKIYLAMLILCVLRRENQEATITWKHRAVFLGSDALLVLLTMTTMFLAWTSVGQETIQGLQGRYFIPCLLPGLLCLENSAVRIHRETDRFAMTVGIIMQMAIIMEVLLNTMLI